MSKGKLLLADDSVTIQKVVNLTFADEGIEVITVGNGDLAWQKIGEERPDIVLADVNMPGLTGYEICEKMRSSEETKNVPVMLLVGSFEPFDEEAAQRVGASGHLTKPFQSIRLLVSRVKELLNASLDGMAQPGMIEAEIRNLSTVELSNEPAAQEPETTDIDELYHKSFADTVEITESDEGFTDAGMDDEIIETHFVSVDDEKSPSANSEFLYPTPFDKGSLDKVPDRSLHDNLESAETSNDSEIDGLETTLNLTPSASDYATAVQRDSKSDGTVGENLVRFEQPVDLGFELDEIELLELPRKKAVQSTSHTTVETADSAENSVQIANLSPELIDLIVEKVLKKLSKKN